MSAQGSMQYQGFLLSHFFPFFGMKVTRSKQGIFISFLKKCVCWMDLLKQTSLIGAKPHSWILLFNSTKEIVKFILILEKGRYSWIIDVYEINKAKYYICCVSCVPVHTVNHYNLKYLQKAHRSYFNPSKYLLCKLCR